jgi:hypothetical protein
MLFNLAQLGFEQAGERVKLQRVDRGMEGFQATRALRRLRLAR